MKELKENSNFNPGVSVTEESFSYENRPRFTEAEIRTYLAGEARKSNKIHHLLDNLDGSFSVLTHIVCEFCDYCVEQGDVRGEADALAEKAKPDPYQGENCEEWLLCNGYEDVVAAPFDSLQFDNLGPKPKFVGLRFDRLREGISAYLKGRTSPRKEAV